MKEFFGRFLGGSRSPEVPRDVPPPQEVRGGDSEVVALREKKFRAELEAFLGRAFSQERFDIAKQKISSETGVVPPLVAEEVRAKIAQIAQESGWVPEPILIERYEPMSDFYEAMGTRRRAFEEAFIEHLGRPVTQEDIDDARYFFEHDSDIKERWSTLVGEEVSAYARKVADIIRNPAVLEGVEDYEDGDALAAK